MDKDTAMKKLPLHITDAMATFACHSEPHKLVRYMFSASLFGVDHICAVSRAGMVARRGRASFPAVDQYLGAALGMLSAPPKRVSLANVPELFEWAGEGGATADHRPCWIEGAKVNANLLALMLACFPRRGNAEVSYRGPRSPISMVLPDGWLLIMPCIPAPPATLRGGRLAGGYGKPPEVPR